MGSHAGKTRLATRAPVCLAQPQPGDFNCVPIAGGVGLGIEFGSWLAGDQLEPYDHAEVFIGEADRSGPYGYTVSAYPDNGKNGRTGKRALPCAPQLLPGSIWSSGLIDLSFTQRANIIDWCLAHQNVKYSALDYAAIAMHTFHLDVPGLKSYIRSTDRMICSYYVDAAYNLGGSVHLFEDGRWEGYVKPGDLADLLETEVHLASMREEKGH